MPLLRRGWEAYIRLLQRRPYVGNSATGAIVMLSGDALAQWHEQRGASASKRCDGKRAAVMVVFSVVIFMPTNTPSGSRTLQSAAFQMLCVRVARTSRANALHLDTLQLYSYSHVDRH
jgi:hypothetical protein